MKHNNHNAVTLGIHNAVGVSLLCGVLVYVCPLQSNLAPKPKFKKLKFTPPSPTMAPGAGELLYCMGPMERSTKRWPGGAEQHRRRRTRILEIFGSGGRKIVAVIPPWSHRFSSALLAWSP